MTREEAIERLNIHKSTSVFVDSIAEAIDMAIEALSEETIEIKPIEIKGDFHIDDIDKNRRSIFEDIVWAVRCKDCRHRDLFSCPLAENDFQKDDDYYSWGERREP